MIPFEYRTPKNLKEVHATLQEFGPDAKLIAGGTALVIMMKQRLVRPSCVVSLRSVRGLKLCFRTAEKSSASCVPT